MPTDPNSKWYVRDAETKQRLSENLPAPQASIRRQQLLEAAPVAGGSHPVTERVRQLEIVQVLVEG